MNNIFLALDFPNWEQTRQFLDENNLHGIPVKVGMELFYKEGVSVIENLKDRDHAIFLDLKLHDIPTTVMRAMKNLAALEVDYVNLHALGGGQMIQKAKEGLQSKSASSHHTKLLAVTILTSTDEQRMNKDLRLKGTVEENVVHFAKLANDNGADGVVCSVHEVKKIKQSCNESFLTMTPGIRLRESTSDDQKRIATPAFAKAQGTDAIVIGRSITKSQNPKNAYAQAVEEWENGTSK
ncbi:orotidine-5'-phosphate decarboxylase [Pseudogracilibacillus sp. SE30717A]|uniref:orotidine-5'-phosphate decarboxylase n=1 Tax=Pseudogracilibacillus sp. SE30717A TaxID=3098293 RepID=UPI00300E1B01